METNPENEPDIDQMIRDMAGLTGEALAKADRALLDELGRARAPNWTCSPKPKPNPWLRVPDEKAHGL